MAILDFIKNRQTSEQSPATEKTQEQKPENAKQMYARDARQEEASRKPLSGVPPDKLAEVAEIKARLEKATQHNQPSPDQPPPAAANSPAPADGSESPEAMRQKATNQDRSAPQQSPTSAQMGSTQVEKSSSAPSAEVTGTPSKPSPTPSGTRPQTLPRPRPSWER